MHNGVADPDVYKLGLGLAIWGKAPFEKPQCRRS